MFALIKEVNTTIKLLLVLVKLINQSFNYHMKDFSVHTKQRKQLLLLDAKLRLANIHNARKNRGV